MKHVWLWGAALALSGCCLTGTPSPTAEPPLALDESLDPADADGLFEYAVTERTAVEAPARLRAAIPTSVEDFREWPDTAPPRHHLEARLCAGDPSAISGWLAAAEVAGRSAAPIDVAMAFARPMRFCAEAIQHELRRRVPDTQGPGARSALLYVLAGAGADEDEALLVAPDAPPLATLAWIKSRAYDHALSPALADAALRALDPYMRGISPTGDILEPCGAGLEAVGELVEAGRVPALLALHGTLSGFGADCLATGLRGAADARAQAAFADACPRVRRPHLCERLARAPSPRAPAEAAPTVDAQVRAYDFDRASVPPSGPRFEAVVDALARCAADEDRSQCLTHLAALDRPRAVTVARAWSTAHPDAAREGELARALERFAEAGSTSAYLGELGFADVGSDEAVVPLDVLMAARRAVVFDTETGMFPNQHDALLIELSLLAPGALDGVLFEEIVEGTPGGVALGEGLIADSVDGMEGDDPEGVYLLHAYDAGTRFAATAQNLGDWYDVDAVVGLLNTLARARGSDVRWLLLRTGGQEAIVVAGPAAGLRRGVADGWFEPSGRGSSASARDHEAEILEQLMRSGQLGGE